MVRACGSLRVAYHPGCAFLTPSGPTLFSAPLSRQTHGEGRRLRVNLAHPTRTHGRVQLPVARSTQLVFLTMPLLSSMSPAFYRGFLRTPARRSCGGALCHLFTVCLVVEAILLTRFIVKEQETLSRVLRADLLSETAAAYPEALVMEYRVRSKQLRITSPAVPLVVPFPPWYADTLDCLASYLGMRYCVNVASLRARLPRADVIFVDTEAQLRSATRNADGRQLFPHWMTVVLGRGRASKSEFRLMGSLFSVGYNSHFNQLKPLFRLFCEEEGGIIRCTKAIVQARLAKLQAATDSSARSATLAIPAAALALLAFAIASMVESVVSVTIIAVPTYVMATVMMTCQTPQSLPVSSAVWQMCAYTFTVYGFVWALAGDMYTGMGLGGWEDAPFALHLASVYIVWTLLMCRVAVQPTVAAGAGVAPRQGAAGAGVAPRQGAAGPGVAPRQGAAGPGVAPRQGAAGAGVAPRQGAAGPGMVPAGNAADRAPVAQLRRRHVAGPPQATQTRHALGQPPMSPPSLSSPPLSGDSTNGYAMESQRWQQQWYEYQVRVYSYFYHAAYRQLMEESQMSARPSTQ